MSDANENIISVENLVKRFGDFAAVNEISFSVKNRDIFAFLGPNGAGKTTTIKMLITLLSPSSGTAKVDGRDIVHDAAGVRRVIGYVPQMISVDGALTAYENLMLMARLYDIPSRQIKDRINEILAFFKLETHAKSLVRTFSGGMIRKLEVGQAMLHHPRVLFLDEPTTGLDPIAKQSVWEHLKELRSLFGTTIFFSTHNMEEASDAADQIAIMNTGKIVTIGTLSQLTEKTGKQDADLEDAFIFFTGDSLQHQTGSFRDIKHARQRENRLR
jgi:ABC-2 type transport system ATP-binding protein